MHELNNLASGKSIIYIATRLFDYAEKVKAEALDTAVNLGISRALKEAALQRINGATATFVPFRDTTQKGGGRSSAMEGIGDPSALNERIYREDTERLNRSFALVSFFDGLSKDEGVCMEIGYCYGIKKPIVLLLSDFVRSDFKGVPNSEHLVDPVLTAMATKIIYQYDIPEIDGTFNDQLQAALRMLYLKIEEEIYLLCLRSTSSEKPIETDELTIKHDVCIDFGGGLFEWQRILQKELAQILLQQGISCVVNNRYSYYKENSSKKSIMELGRQDIHNAVTSKLIVTCSDSTEMTSGTAALQGYARALEKKVILYNSKTTHMVGDLNYRSSRNLMIDYSAHSTISKFEDIASEVKNLLQK